MSSLKRQAHFRRLSNEAVKRFRLDPAPEPEDLEGNYMPGPFGDEISEIQECMAETEELWSGTEELETRLKGLETSMEELKTSMKELKTMRKQMDDNDKALPKRKLKMLLVNALIDLAKMVARTHNSDYKDDPSTTKLQQFAAMTTDAQLANANIPPKYWQPLRRLDQYVPDRNHKIPESETECAYLISSERFTRAFEFWKDIFPLAYGKSVEELAREQAEFLEMLETCLGYHE